MKFKKDSYYLVYVDVDDDDDDGNKWCFKYNFHIESDFICVYGYSDDYFVEHFYIIEYYYSYKEISVDEAMSYFPNTDKYKISYLRKNRIKSLLNV